MMQVMTTSRDPARWHIICGALILLILLQLVHGSTGKRQ